MTDNISRRGFLETLIQGGKRTLLGAALGIALTQGMSVDVVAETASERAVIESRITSLLLQYQELTNERLMLNPKKIGDAENIIQDIVIYYKKSKQYGKLIDLSARELQRLTGLHERYGVRNHYKLNQIYDTTALAYHHISLTDDVGENMVSNARLSEITGFPLKDPEKLTDEEAWQLNDRLVGKMFEHYLKSLLIFIKNNNRTPQENKLNESFQQSIAKILFGIYHKMPKADNCPERRYALAFQGKAFNAYEKNQLLQFFNTRFSGMVTSRELSRDDRSELTEVKMFYLKPLR